MKKAIIFIFLALSSLLPNLSVNAQTSTMTIRENPALSLKKFVPKGSYSGITRISGNTYAVVSDSEELDGFFKFNIELDPETGAIRTVENIGYYNAETANRDNECVAYNPRRNTIYVGGERNNSIVEYTIEGKPTGQRSVNLIPNTRQNLGMESLCYDAKYDLIWAMTEGTLITDNDGNYTTDVNGVAHMLRLTAFDTNFNKIRELAYRMDSPTNLKAASRYTMGVSDITVLDDGRILVLEREAYVPKVKYGSWVNCKLYLVDPQNAASVGSKEALKADSQFMDKTLIWSCNTQMSLNGLNWANYEGMCLGPKLSDGSQVIILISDSQNRYNGLLKDWMKTLVIK